MTGQVAVGADPAALALGDGSLWVANTVDQTVSRIDLASGKVTRAIAVGGVPISLAVGRNAVWVVRRRADGYPELIRIDPRFDVVVPGRRPVQGGDPRPTPGQPSPPARTVSGSAAEGGLLQRLDPAGTAVTATYRHGQQHHQRRDRRGRGVGQRRARQQRRPHRPGHEARDRDDPGRTRAGRRGSRARARSGWPTDSTAPSSGSTRQRTRSRRRSRSAAGPTGIAVGLGSVWVANSRDGTVSRIDPGTQRGRKDDQGGRKPAGDRGRERPGLGVRPDCARRSRRPGRRPCASRPTRIDSLDPAVALHASAPGRSSTRPARNCSTTRTVRRRRGHGSCRRLRRPCPSAPPTARATRSRSGPASASRRRRTLPSPRRPSSSRSSGR